MKTHVPFSRLTGPTLGVVAADCRRLAAQAHSLYQKHDDKERYWLDEAWEFTQLAEAAEHVPKGRRKTPENAS